MKSFVKFLVVAAVVVSAASVSFAALVSSTTVSMSATVTGVNTMTVAVKKIVDNTSDTAITFGSVSSGGSAYNSAPAQYVQFNVDDNSSWKLRTWTANYTTQPATATWGFQYGGLKGSVNGNKIGMGWQASTSTVAGGPTKATPGSAWTYLKDQKDVDDPSTSPANESFATSDGAGYTVVAFGTGSYTRVTIPMAAGGNVELATRTSPFYLYTEGDFSVANADSFTGSIWFDLTNY